METLRQRFRVGSRAESVPIQRALGQMGSGGGGRGREKGGWSGLELRGRGSWASERKRALSLTVAAVHRVGLLHLILSSRYLENKPPLTRDGRIENHTESVRASHPLPRFDPIHYAAFCPSLGMCDFFCFFFNRTQTTSQSCNGNHLSVEVFELRQGSLLGQ